MKRLTMKDENGYYLKDKSATITWNSLIGENRYRGEAIDRLAAIEDILCGGEDEYDLARVTAERDGAKSPEVLEAEAALKESKVET